MKVVRNIIVGFIAVVYFVFVIVNTIFMLNINDFGVTQFDDKTFVVIKSNISSDKYKKGDLVIVQKPRFDQIKIEDELFVYKIKKDGSPIIDIGVVGDLHDRNKAVSFDNGAGYEMDYIIGKESKVIPEIGTYFGLVQSQWGFLFIILVPSFLIFIYELYAIIVEIKYGKPELEEK